MRPGFHSFALPLPLLLAACIGGGREEPRRPSATRPAKTPTPPSDSAVIRQCKSDMLAAGVQFESLPDRSYDGGCTVFGAVKLLDVGVPTANLGALTCPLAQRFAAWAKNGAMPAARVYFGQELVRIETMGTYSCRPIAGTGRLSEHGRANAIDIAAFVLADGRRISVLADWNGEDQRARDFLRRIRQSACRRFTTVLSPDYNAAHRDHFHLDMGGRNFCR